MDKQRKRFLRGQATLLLGLLLLCAYLLISSRLLHFAGGCFFHDFLLLYCPFCGGTRAVKALLCLDLAAAWRYNALIVHGAIGFLAIETIAWIRFAMKREPLPTVSPRAWVVVLVVLVGYCILRNVLMIVCGIDPTGDLGNVWRKMRG